MGIIQFYGSDNKVLKKTDESIVELIILSDRVSQVLETDRGLIVILGGLGRTKPGNMYLIDVGSGSIIWQAEAAPGISYDQKERKCVYGKARVEEDKLVVWAEDGLEHEVDWHTGKHLKVLRLVK
ncbi:MAG TPA: hypothetical protein PLH57_01955 [Oligoflexia bacterium]|nr:hypothetical protein [Oligoflexia bacterium]